MNTEKFIIGKKYRLRPFAEVENDEDTFWTFRYTLAHKYGTEPDHNCYGDYYTWFDMPQYMDRIFIARNECYITLGEFYNSGQIELHTSISQGIYLYPWMCEEVIE